MPIRNLEKIFRPRSVAIIGASGRAGQVGNTVLKNLLTARFDGSIAPINPKYGELEGVRCFGAVGELASAPDLAVICTPAATVAGLVRECGRAGTRGLIVLSAGFRETGETGRALESEVLAAAREFPGLRIVGPNCLGVLVPGIGLNASFAAAMPPAGKVAFVSQSGALCTAVLDWSLREHVGFSHFVSVGNMLDVSIGDLIDYFAADEGTSSLLLYIESLSQTREFMSAARAFARVKPIIAYKAGRFAESAKAASSHTGALAGVDAVYEAALHRAGIVRVFDMESLFSCAELLGRQRLPQGKRLAIVTNAGGPGVMATDALIQRRGELASLTPETLAALDTLLPAAWSHGNPIDVLGDATPERFAQGLDLALKDPGVDAAVALLTPQAMTDPTATAEAVAQVAARHRRPILAAWMGGNSMRAGVEILNRAGVSTFDTPEHAVGAFSHMVQYAGNLELLYETPREVPMSFQPDRARASEVVEEARSQGRALLTEDEAKRFLAAYGIPVTIPQTASSAAAAARAAGELGYPVVLKILSPQITHKTDVGGVVLNLRSDAEVREAFEAIVARAKIHRPDARIDGVTVQKMITAVNGIELILGARKDPVFGAVIMVGMGGIATEVFQDRALELPPLNERLARRMLESLRAWKLLQGYRGRPAANLDRLVEVLLRLSYLVADRPEIEELDVNPLLVTPEDVIALDARVILDHRPEVQTALPYAHLAIRPYPREFTRGARLRDGSDVLLRPIKPEDEPLWLELLRSCSEQTLWFRFRYLFKEATHAMASRYCYIDYDREMALVAEIVEAGRSRLIGVGRLVADPDHQEAEFAVLVADQWQGQGAGRLLLEECLSVAKRWGIRLIVGETTPDNARMLALFSSHGFELDYNVDPQTVVARREG